jgi:hypothetical protein
MLYSTSTPSFDPNPLVVFLDESSKHAQVEGGEAAQQDMSTGLEGKTASETPSAIRKRLMHGHTGLFRYYVNTTIDASSTASINPLRQTSTPFHHREADGKKEQRAQGCKLDARLMQASRC